MQLADLAGEQLRPLHANCSAVSHVSLNNKSVVKDSVLPSRNMSAACKNKEASMKLASKQSSGRQDS